MNEHMTKALECFDNNQAALAKALGVSAPYVHKIIRTGHVPVEQCRNIERVTNGTVTAEQLRPDIFLPPEKVA